MGVARSRRVDGGRARVRAGFAVVAGVVGFAACGAMSATGASSSTVVSVTIPSATSIDATGCASGTANITDFGLVLPGTSAVTSSNCIVRFGSSNDTASLRVAQQDRLGGAMWQHTRGALDASFDGPGGAGNGRFLFAIGSGHDYAYSGVPQADGKLLMTGECHNGTNDDFCVARLLVDGSWSTSLVGPSGTGNGRFLLPIGAGNDAARSSVLQPDGKLLISGWCHNGANEDFCAARLHVDGSWDTSFVGPSGTGNGRFLLPIGAGTDYASSSVLQPDGKLLIVGTCHNGANEDFCVARLHVDGSWDTSFVGPSGNGNGRFLLPIGAGGDIAKSIVMQADGKLLLTGHCHNGTSHDFCAARLNVDGSWDSSFVGPSGAGNGRFLLPIGAGDDRGQSSVLQTDGKLIITGFCHNGANNDFCVARLNVDGSWDTGFVGPSGTGNGRFLLPIGTGNDAAAASVQQADGKLLITGWCHNGADFEFCVARLNVNGSWDTSLVGPGGTDNGRFLLPMGAGHDFPLSAALQDDGRLLIVGYCHNGTNQDFCAASLDQAGRLDDYANASRDWSVGTSMFGACLDSVAAGASAAWTVNAGCAQTNGSTWNAVQATPSVIATTGVVGTLGAEARLRFGMRAATNQSPGDYVAPVTFDVVAPAT